MERYISLKNIVETGSFTKAAEMMGYTQPALSQSISSLEKDMGFRLLKRSRSGVELTSDGAEIYPYIERIVRDRESMQRKIDEIHGMENAVIRFASFTSISTYLLPQLFAEFKTLYPNVDFQVSLGGNIENTEAVKSGAVDFAFVSKKHSYGLKVREIGTINLEAVLPVGHPLTELDVIPIEAFDGIPYIYDEYDEKSQNDELKDTFEALGVKPDIRYSIENDNAALAMVAAGLGVSILSSLSVEHTGFDVVSRPIYPPIERITAIGYLDESTLPLAAKKFIEFIEQVEARRQAAVGEA